MHMGSFALNAATAPSNYKHIVFNNRVHDSVGGQPTASPDINVIGFGKAIGYNFVDSVSTKEEIISGMEALLENNSIGLLEIKVNKGVRSDITRPATTPLENKKEFVDFLNG